MARTMNAAEGGKKGRKPATTTKTRRKIVKAGADEFTPQLPPQPTRDAGPGSIRNQTDSAKSIYHETLLPMQSQGAAFETRIAPSGGRPMPDLPMSGGQIRTITTGAGKSQLTGRIFDVDLSLVANKELRD